MADALLDSLTVNVFMSASTNLTRKLTQLKINNGGANPPEKI